MGKSEELSPLLAAKQLDGEAAGHGDGSEAAAAAPMARSGWTADGLPLAQGSFLGEPVGRAHWDSGLFSCLGRNDDFCSSDLEVCEYNPRADPGLVSLSIAGGFLVDLRKSGPGIGTAVYRTTCDPTIYLV
ncbi:hypothetical protein Taro_036301 [Colocasia esculenta]|uniref:Uncharacterized protein n=1 Tax=Colocasia esculenta TaxID=4460 RepID=A0A843WHH6_COLES|nr:hypothetical protein [Colocasia esculenta]